MSELAFKSAIQLAQMIKDREIGSLELLEYYLDRVQQFNDSINAIIVQDTERARSRAKEADKALSHGEIWGPLHGVPMTCKESFNVAGLPTTFGIPEFKDNIADTDALSIQRLKSAGAVFFGKTNVPLGLADFQSYNDIYGTTSNPWNTERIPGGSSGGSAAALAAGLTGFEIGSDIGGSIRNPAHFCGVFGHKPTWGLLPPRGHTPTDTLAQPDLAVIGPLGRSASDLELGVCVMAGPDEIDSAGYSLNLQSPSQKSLSEYRVAVWANDTISPVAHEVANSVETIAQTVIDAGGHIDPSARPEMDIAAGNDVYLTMLFSVMASRMPHDAFLELQTRAASFDPDNQSPMAVQLRRQTATLWNYAQANEARTKMRWTWHKFFKSYDILIAPIMATPAIVHDHSPQDTRTIDVDGQTQPYFQQLFWPGIAICAYLPSTIIPVDLSSEGLPIGIQIIGPQYGDLKTIGFAKLLEEAGFGFKTPPGY